MGSLIFLVASFIQNWVLNRPVDCRCLQVHTPKLPAGTSSVAKGPGIKQPNRMENFSQYLLYLRQIPQKNCGSIPPRPEKAKWGTQPLWGCNKVSQHCHQSGIRESQAESWDFFPSCWLWDFSPPTHTVNVCVCVGDVDFHPQLAAMRSLFPAILRLHQKRPTEELDLSSSPSGNKATSSALSMETRQKAWTPSSAQ